MTLKQYVRFIIPANNKHIKTACTLMGLSFFLRMLYFFGLTDLNTVSGMKWTFELILPALACGGFIVLIGVLQWNHPGICGILCSAMLLFLAIGNIGCGDALRIVLSLVGYTLSAGLLFLTIGGYFPIRAIFNSFMWLSAGVRLFLFDLGNLSLKEWVLEAAVIFFLLSLTMFVNGMKPRPVHKA